MGFYEVDLIKDLILA